ncbi:MAG: DUF1800 family protein [Planctomycetota bacterium]
MLWIPLALTLLAASSGPGDAAIPRVRFAVESTTVWRDRGAVLVFDCAEPAPQRRVLPVTSSTGSLEILDPPVIEAGALQGSLRVRGEAQGVTRLRVGHADLVVRVRELPAEARLWRSEPRIVAPVLGAAVSGVVTVGVEVPRAESRRSLDVALELPGGERLAPAQPYADDGGATMRRRFDVDVDALGRGTHGVRALVLDGAVVVGETTGTLRVVRPSASSLAGECEDSAGDRGSRIGRADGASDGGYVELPRANVLWRHPITIESDGAYQAFARVRGDFAGGAYPSLALVVDGETPYAGSTRLVDHRWQRLPIGAPVALEAGEHDIALRLLNDLDVGDRSDRALFVDAWELVRIDDESLAVADDRRQRGPRGAGLWIGFERAFDGQRMNGRLRIAGAANWSGPIDSGPPLVELRVDGRTAFTQETPRPLFALDRAHLGPGVHEISLRATMPDGREAVTPIQRIVVEGPVADVRPRDVYRFDLHDSRWDEGLRAHLDGEGEEERQRVVRPREAASGTLRIPEGLVGTFELVAEARAGGGQPAATIAATVAGDERVAEVRGWWGFHSLGRVTLDGGGAPVEVRLAPRADDPQLRVRSLLLQRVRPGEDRTPPTARLAYPSDGHAAHGVDAIVVDAFDDDALESVDVLIDGRPQGTWGEVPEGAGAVFAPLLLRDVAPGEHTLAVRVRDRAGNSAETEPVVIEVLASAPAQVGRYARAVHLLDRLGFGPEPDELAAILAYGEDAWLSDALYGDRRGHAVARGFADVRAGDRIAYDADRLALTYLLRTDEPVLARHVLWIDDHFSTWSGKTGAPSEWAHHRELARLGWAPFGEQLRASATGAVMLVYLDQERSFAGRINENYAREVLELHTVGVDGGYDQGDVTALACLLAGLTVSQEAPADGSGVYQRREFRFDPELSDGRACALFDRVFPRVPTARRLDRVVEALELLARRPETARFVAQKLGEHYVSAPAPEALTDDLAAVFQSSGGDFRAVLEALVAHPEFWAAASEPRLTTPIDFGLRVARVTGNETIDWSLRAFLRNSGMGLFDRVSPDGYPDDDASWADTNGIVQRWRWIQEIPWVVHSLVPSEMRRVAAGDPQSYRQRVVDHAAVRLLGRTLGAESNAAALQHFEECADLVSWKRVNRVVELVSRLPESNLK